MNGKFNLPSLRKPCTNRRKNEGQQKNKKASLCESVLTVKKVLKMTKKGLKKTTTSHKRRQRSSKYRGIYCIYTWTYTENSGKKYSITSYHNGLFTKQGHATFSKIATHIRNIYTYFSDHTIDEKHDPNPYLKPNPNTQMLGETPPPPIQNEPLPCPHNAP